MSTNIETINYESGDRYQGEAQNGVKNGKGKYFFKNGNIYEGGHKNDKFNGYGKLTFKDGDYKEGLFEDNKLVEGKVRETNSNGWVYVGEEKNEQRHGIGTLYKPDGSIYYEGHFLFGKRKTAHDNLSNVISKICSDHGFKKNFSQETNLIGLFSSLFKSNKEEKKTKHEDINQITEKYFAKDYKGFMQGFIFLFFSNELLDLKNNQEVFVRFLKSYKELYGLKKNYENLLDEIYIWFDNIEIEKLKAENYHSKIQDYVSEFGKADYVLSDRKCFSNKKFDTILLIDNNTTNNTILSHIEQYINKYKQMGYSDNKLDSYYKELQLKIENTRYVWNLRGRSSGGPKNKDGSPDLRYSKNRK